jgi:hypothetical protein
MFGYSSRLWCVRWSLNWGSVTCTRSACLGIHHGTGVHVCVGWSLNWGSVTCTRSASHHYDPRMINSLRCFNSSNRIDINANGTKQHQEPCIQRRPLSSCIMATMVTMRWMYVVYLVNYIHLFKQWKIDLYYRKRLNRSCQLLFESTGGLAIILWCWLKLSKGWL